MMRNVCLILTLLQIIYLRETSAYGNGAPSSSCDDLTPGHGSELKQTAPYKVTVEKQADGYKVTLAATDTAEEFEGFIMQGREVNGKGVAIGNFTVAKDSKSPMTLAYAFQCNSAKDTVTHYSSTSKTKVEFLWDPPRNLDGKIKFHATVARTKNNWWKGITSDEILIDTTMPTATSALTTKPQSTSSSLSKSSINAAVMTTPTSATHGNTTAAAMTTPTTATHGNTTTASTTIPTSNAMATTSIFILVVTNLVLLMSINIHVKF